jgi:hypothetical protein
VGASSWEGGVDGGIPLSLEEHATASAATRKRPALSMRADKKENAFMARISLLRGNPHPIPLWRPVE